MLIIKSQLYIYYVYYNKITISYYLNVGIFLLIINKLQNYTCYVLIIVL